MADTDFDLRTTCPDGHTVLFRRKLSTWRLSLEAPAVVLWCYECGLEWSALDRDRAAVAEAVWRATATKNGRRAEDAPGGNLKARAVNADGAAQRRKRSPRLQDAIANAATEYVGQPTALVTRFGRSASAPRRHARDCGTERRHTLFAGIGDPQRRCRGRQAAHSRGRSMTLVNARGPAHDVLIGRARWDRSWWSPAALGAAVVALLALLWIPQPGFLHGTGNEAVGLRTSAEQTQGVDAAIVSEVAPAEPRTTTADESSEAVGVAAPAASGQP